jgi:XXXCH domain-containing protein
MTDETKRELSPPEAARYFRQLADAVDQGRVGPARLDLAIQGGVKIKESVKTKGGKVGLEIKVKFAGPAAWRDGQLRIGPEPVLAEAAPGLETPATPAVEAGARPPSYKKLKKAMQKDFKAIGQAVEAARQPPPEIVRSFCRAGREMIAFPDRGDEYYPRFEAGLAALEAAAASRDLAAVARAHTDLDQIKEDCHDRFK